MAPIENQPPWRLKRARPKPADTAQGPVAAAPPRRAGGAPFRAAPQRERRASG